MADIPSDAPPSYQQATGSSATSSSRPNAGSSTSPTTATSSHLEVPGARQNGIPAEYRRSMEDEGRPLPEGWVRTFDPKEQHQFYVDTRQDPPRSIWTHPLDDDQYLSTLSSEERERLEQDSFNRGKHTSKADIAAAHTDDEDDEHHTASSSSAIPDDLPPREGKGKGKEDNRSFGRKFKDKVTGMTHEQREQERERRYRTEQQMYEQHMRVRQAMSRAAQTGQPQWVGKDGDGRDIYVEPPMYQPPGGGYPGRGYGVNPYRGGIYTTPDARYIRPPNPYVRQRGYGYGGGYGLPLMLGGGLLGGMLIGDALF